MLLHFGVSSDEVEGDGIKPDLESTELLIVPFPFSTVNENIDSPYSRIPKFSSSLGLFESVSLFFSKSRHIYILSFCNRT